MIRTVQGTDIEGIVAGWNRSLLRDPVTDEQMATWLFADPDFDIATGEGAWVAEEKGKVAGFIRAIKRYMPNDAMGIEPEHGWIAAMFVAPEHRRQGLGKALIEKATEWLATKGTKQIFVCGNTGSAPGYFFPGVDLDAYAAAFALFKKCGYVVDHEPIAMSGSLLDMDTDALLAEAWDAASSEGVEVSALTPADVADFLTYLREAFPGDWNTASRNKMRGAGLGQFLIARVNGEVVGHCQWESDGHFGPFGVSEKARNKKIGGKLFAEACRQLRLEGARDVWFNWADEAAARFYQRRGLVQTRRFAIMRKDL